MREEAVEIYNSYCATGMSPEMVRDSISNVLDGLLRRRVKIS